MGLRNQLLLIIIIVILIIIGAIFYYFARNHRNFYIEQLKNSLQNEAMLIKANEEVQIENQTPAQLDEWSKEWGKKINARITIVDESGIVLADSRHDPANMDNHIDRPEIKEVSNGTGVGSSIRFSNTLNMDMLYLAIPVTTSRGELAGVIRLAKSLQNINQVVKNYLKQYFFFFISLLLISIALIWRFTSNLINPLQEMTELVSEIAGGNYSKRINLKGNNREIKKLKQKFNFMAEKLDNKIKEISTEKNKIKAILSSMVDGLIAIDEKQNVILINPAARKMLSLQKVEINGKSLTSTVRNHRLSNFMEEALTERNIISQEIVLNREEEKILRCHFAPIINEKEKLLGGVIVMTDITELRHLEQVRKEFVANVSHELKTPLTSIIGYVDTLLESNEIDQETSQRFLRVIKDEADRLEFLIQDLLHLSKVEQENPDLKPGYIQEVADRTINRLREKAEKKNVKLRGEYEDDLPPVFMIREQIEQVLVNLVDNSIKYTEQDGEVIIRLSPRGDQIKIEVEDNGIGIPYEDQDRIFERFYRVDKARSRELGGTGIGLSIVKHIVQNHNSKINLESTPGEGSRFWFDLKIVDS